MGDAIAIWAIMVCVFAMPAACTMNRDYQDRVLKVGQLKCETLKEEER